MCFFQKTSPRRDSSSKLRGLLGAWPEALQWMVLSMTLSIFNKWTPGSAGGSCNLKPFASFQLLLDHVLNLNTIRVSFQDSSKIWVGICL